MKTQISILSLMFIFSAYIFSQDSINSNNVLEVICQLRESKRIIEQSEIKTYKDLECTYWTPEREASDFEYNEGYIFLPNNTILIVRIYFELIDIESNGTTEYGMYSIYSIDNLYKYDIKDARLVVNIGIPIIILKDSYLYVTYDKKEYKKYRLENKFVNHIDLTYPN
jgi:hypothetical protein